jgi:hypothetical protein
MAIDPGGGFAHPSSRLVGGLDFNGEQLLKRIPGRRYPIQRTAYHY